DFTSIPLINTLAKHIRDTQKNTPHHFTLSEMLPTKEQLWLTDHHQNTYTSELRIVTRKIP
ncbi:hypothetical protein, partial [Nocardiopsis alba]|uniref:hypothetical protein n=1 Tax=Nocardiopsis alba TaxID=53437 RepID=UPI0033FC1A34